MLESKPWGIYWIWTHRHEYNEKSDLAVIKYLPNFHGHAALNIIKKKFSVFYCSHADQIPYQYSEQQTVKSEKWKKQCRLQHCFPNSRIHKHLAMKYSASENWILRKITSPK